MPLRTDAPLFLKRLLERDITPGFEDGARRGNRRRFKVFATTFLAVLLLGQAWNLRSEERRVGKEC